MAFALVQNNAANMANGASPLTVTLQNTPVQGNIIIVSIANLTNGNALTSVVDGNSNALTLLQSEPRSTTLCNYIYAMVAGASQSKSFTAMLSGATLYATAYEFSGNITNIAGMVNKKGLVNGTASSTSTPSLVITQPTALIFKSVSLLTSIGTISASNSTLLQTNPSSAAALLVDSYQIETANGTYSPTISWSGSHSYASSVVALNPIITQCGSFLHLK